MIFMGFIVVAQRLQVERLLWPRPRLRLIQILCLRDEEGRRLVHLLGLILALRLVLPFCICSTYCLGSQRDEQLLPCQKIEHYYHH